MRIEIDKARRLARITLHGQIHADDVIGSFRELLDHPDLTADTNSLWDLSDGSLAQVSRQDVHDVESYMRGFRDVRNGIKAACVCPQDLNYGFARMYEMLCERVGSVRFRVFRSVAEAEAWLASDDSESQS
jgi:hypothetical protein